MVGSVNEVDAHIDPGVLNPARGTRREQAENTGRRGRSGETCETAA
jgi:hypothetical protein